MRSLRGFVSMTVLALAASCSSDPKSVAPAPAAGGEMLDSAGGQVAQCHPTCTAASDCAVPGSALDDAEPLHLHRRDVRLARLPVRRGVQHGRAQRGPAPRLPVGPGSAGADLRGRLLGAGRLRLGRLAPRRRLAFRLHGGACVWQGCRSTSECASALHVQKVVCEEPAGAPAPTCEPTCTTAADCADSSAPLEDASHFACKAGRCQWLGCKSTADCTSGLHSSHYVCE